MPHYRFHPTVRLFCVPGGALLRSFEIDHVQSIAISNRLDCRKKADSSAERFKLVMRVAFVHFGVGGLPWPCSPVAGKWWMCYDFSPISS
jgi:hypothetical protein